MGVPLPQAQELLGHAALTVRYLKMTGAGVHWAAHVLPLGRFLGAQDQE